MALSQVACLVPLNDDLKENNSAPRIVLSEGPNTIGRDNFSVADKRLSRKHLIVTASAQGDSAVLHVEGTNPVVVKSGAGRQKICRGEELMIDDGDVIEFIPGHYFFKFVAFPSDNNSKNECKNNGSNERAPKKARLGGVQDHSKDGIRDFHLPEEEVPRTFRLLRVQGLPSWANTSSVSIEDIIQGDIVVAILSNYMVDVDWLMSACPKLGKIPQVLVIHGEGDGRQEYMQRRKPANWILHKPRLPISFGTHHSKAIILIYPRGVRIVVHTANLIYVDWNNKTQGLWMQDFPWKNGESPSKITGFEVDLIDYLGVLKWPEFSASIPGRGNLKIDASFFKMFDYADATVRLVASVPGYHTGTSMRKWGHMKFRTILDSCNFADEFKKSPLIYQFSSLGSLDEKWLSEFTSSMSAGLSVDKTPLGYGDPQIIWPTVEDVRCSLEGYAAGNAVPSPLKNVEKGFLKKYWFKWKADHSGRGRAMPHIKTFTRYNGQNLAWYLLTSSNLSKAAWGALQKNNSQLMIRSYELGVLFIPSLIKRRARFSCTRNMYPVQDKSEPADNTTNRRTKFVTLAWQGDHDTASAADVIRMPVPYELPPQRYSSEDVPWSWDRIYSKKDVYGQVWPRQVQLYATDHD